MSRRTLLRSTPRSIAETDAEILQRVARGETGAVGELYDRYGDDLLRFATRLGGGRDAEDVVQETFLRVVRIAASFEAKGPSARAWLFGVAARIVRERRRALRRFLDALDRLASQPHDHAHVAQCNPDLERVLARLSLAKRSVVVLSEIEGFTSEEIAAILSIPVGTVWTRLHSARKEMRIGLGGHP